jgi:hypothetical protein
VKYRGVYSSGKKWRCYVRDNGKLLYLGSFVCPEDAAIAHDDFWYKKGKQHLMNFPILPKGLF